MQYWGITLRPGQTIATCQRNISQHCWAQHVACVWLPCWKILYVVGSSLNFQAWANNIQNFEFSIFKLKQNTQNVATYRNTVAKRTQHVALSDVAICCVVGMSRSFGRGFTGGATSPIEIISEIRAPSCNCLYGSRTRDLNLAKQWTTGSRLMTN